MSAWYCCPGSGYWRVGRQLQCPLAFIMREFQTLLKLPPGKVNTYVCVCVCVRVSLKMQTVQHLTLKMRELVQFSWKLNWSAFRLALNQPRVTLMVSICSASRVGMGEFCAASPGSSALWKRNLRAFLNCSIFFLCVSLSQIHFHLSLQSNVWVIVSLSLPC